LDPPVVLGPDSANPIRAVAHTPRRADEDVSSPGGLIGDLDVTPPPEAAVSFYGGSTYPATGYSRPVCVAAYPHGLSAALSRAVTKLAIAIVAPAPERPISFQREEVALARLDRFPVVVATDLRGLRPEAA
jgi:hypothetical protein